MDDIDQDKILDLQEINSRCFEVALKLEPIYLITPNGIINS